MYSSFGFSRITSGKSLFADTGKLMFASVWKSPSTVKGTDGPALTSVC